MKLATLIMRATEAGVDSEALDDAGDADDAKSEVIRLIVDKELQTLPRQVATDDTFSRLYPSDAMTRARDERQGQQKLQARRDRQRARPGLREAGRRAGVASTKVLGLDHQVAHLQPAVAGTA